MSKKVNTAVSAPLKKSQSTPVLSESVSTKKTGGLSVFKTLNISDNKEEKNDASKEDIKNGNIQNKTSTEDVILNNKADDSFIQFLSLSDEYSRVEKVSFYLTSSLTSANVHKGNEINALIVSKVVEKYGINSSEGIKVVEFIQSLSSTSEQHVREFTMILVQRLLIKLGRTLEPIVINLFPLLLSLHADRSQIVRDCSASIGATFMSMICPHSFRKIFPMFMAAIVAEEDWRVKVGSLTLLKAVAPRVSVQLTPLLPDLIPKASECILDSKKQVQVAGLDTLTEACSMIANDDIRPLVPQLVSVIARPDESIKTLDLLLETTFVANVDSPVLALIAPLLGKSLKSRSSVMKRKASKVIDIMCRLVQEPSDVAPFMPLLLPALDKVIDEIVDMEVCDVAKAARAMLLKAMGEGKESVTPSLKPSALMELEKVKNNVLSVFNNLPDIINIKSTITSSKINKFYVDYSMDCLSYLVMYATAVNPNFLPETNSDEIWKYAAAMTTTSEWRECVVPYLRNIIISNIDDASDEIKNSENGDSKLDIELLSNLFRTTCLGEVADSQTESDMNDSNVCDIEFSLAFGGKILLHNTRLRLGKGRRYGLMGKNGAGKTTLLTNIGSGNIEGLPTHLKMMYVQHDDASDDFGISIVDEMMSSKEIKSSTVQKSDAIEALSKIGFTDVMLESPRSNLSGGWKMKLLIVKAMLSGSDILLLDEPTNHLDAASVQWLIDFILSQKETTCLIVSHDTGFMDAVLTDVIHYETRKLVYYHGNLTHFVKIHPEARYYYELEGSTLSFKFPTPERLDGINSTTRSVLKMENISYTYPGAATPQLTNVSVKVCLASRIAVCGANGAGKSTLIKLLVQETEADEGSGAVWKHMNLRVAYVAQHSFHHIEQHLDTTPVDYMKWRFSGGFDKEDMTKASTKLTEDEEQERKGERKYGDIEQILGRRKNGRTMEYECTYVGQNPAREPNKYIAVEKLIELGYSKLVQQCDTKIAAAAAGLAIRPLLTVEIQGHLDDFNLDSEFGTHGTIRRLSGGQKVKLVLAAAMWNRPHIIILDEPTNYLDREALGALTQAIKSFGGGVVIISHNSEFTDTICTEKWIVKDGQCYTQGEAEETALKAVSSNNIKKSNSLPELADSTKEDASGNINKSIVSEVILNPKTLEGLSKKEVRKLEKCAAVAGVSLKEYVSKINCKSPEWKWL